MGIGRDNLRVLVKRHIGFRLPELVPAGWAEAGIVRDSAMTAHRAVHNP
jgi:hypothetical protein